MTIFIIHALATSKAFILKTNFQTTTEQIKTKQSSTFDKLF